MTDKLPVNGQVIGEVQRAIEPLLGSVLNELGTNFPTRVALNLIATKGPVISRTALERDLAEGLGPSSSAGLIEQLESAGLVRTASGDDAGADQIEMTEDGSALHRRIREAITRIWLST